MGLKTLSHAERLAELVGLNELPPKTQRVYASISRLLELQRELSATADDDRFNLLLDEALALRLSIIEQVEGEELKRL